MGGRREAIVNIEELMEDQLTKLGRQLALVRSLDGDADRPAPGAGRGATWLCDRCRETFAVLGEAVEEYFRFRAQYLPPLSGEEVPYVSDMYGPDSPFFGLFESNWDELR
jgi:hypothetical protein